jgi:hypothetical protein
MRLMEEALILTSVARVMETMSSWERSWVVVPVRWGSCRMGEQCDRAHEMSAIDSRGLHGGKR